MRVSVLEVRRGRWAYLLDGAFPNDQFDPTWGMTTYESADAARKAAEQMLGNGAFTGSKSSQKK